ncbi:MAG: flagellar biosynthesis protein FlhA [Treponematales bacterium]
MPEAAAQAPAGAGALFGNPRDAALPVGMVAVVMMLIIPLPTVLLDACMALNLLLSLLILLTVVYSRKPTDFSLFPWVLLVVNVFSLALNVSSTRLILTQGAAFNGRMVKAFATFVTRTDSGSTQGLVVGFIIFLMIFIVQAVVITKGSTRISEVAARFTLDAMPQKQMAIDTEYSSGAITQEEASRRKEEVQQESNFYGAMDGASKFVSGNVTFGIVSTVINILGGIIIGVTIHGETFRAAANTYFRFSIGDGLLSQFPGLLVSTAMGIVVTRAAAPGNLGEQVAKQLSSDSRVYWICAGALALMCLLPGFPWYILAPMAALVGYNAFRIGQAKQKKESFDQMMSKTGAKKKGREEGEDISPIVPFDVLSLELGYGLIPLVDKDRGAELLERVKNVRRTTALELGLVIPMIRIIDNMLLESSEYCFKIKGVDVGKGVIRMGYYLCLTNEQVKEEIPGEKTTDPAFGLAAIWVSEDRRDEAELAGYTVIDPPSIIATHLTEIIKRHAAELLGREETQAMLDAIQKDYGTVVNEVLNPPNQQNSRGLTVGDVQKVLQGLLREQVSIRNLVTILEAIADYAPLTRDTRFLIEKARQALGGQICGRFADEKRMLHVLTLDPDLEKKIVDSKVETSSGDSYAALEHSVQQKWVIALSRSVAAVQQQGYMPVILCSEAARYLTRTALEKELPETAVLSVPEIAQDYTVESVGVIRIEE